MKYYSEMLDELFDSEKDLKESELKKTESDRRKAEAAAKENKRYEDAYRAVREQINAANESLGNFINTYGLRTELLTDLLGL